MTKTNDSIVFENRYEIGDTIHALEDWMKAHPKSEEAPTVAQLISLLDAMEMSW